MALALVGRVLLGGTVRTCSGLSTATDGQGSLHKLLDRVLVHTVAVGMPIEFVEVTPLHK